MLMRLHPENFHQFSIIITRAPLSMFEFPSQHQLIRAALCSEIHMFFVIAAVVKWFS